MKKIILILIATISTLANSQEVFLSGVYEVTFSCAGKTVGDKVYYNFDGFEEDEGYIEYAPTRSKNKYYPIWLGNYSFDDKSLKIEITHQPVASPSGDGRTKLTRIINGEVESYTVKRNYRFISSNGTEFIFGNNDECKDFRIVLKELSEYEHKKFLDKLN